MAQPTFSQLTGNESLSELIEMVAKLQKQVEWLMGGRLGDDNIKANSITAVKLDVEELSAITADMGKLTSGEIYGAYIATKEAAYPRAEMDSTNNHFAAFASSDKYLKIGSFGAGSVPYIEFRDMSSTLSAIINLGSFLLMQSQLRLDIKSVSGDVNVEGVNINLKNATRVAFNNLIDTNTNNSLDAQLTNKASKTSVSKTVYVSTTSGGAATTPLTITNGVVTS